MKRRTRSRASALVVAGLLSVAAPPASARDIHADWENHCLECHGHAGAFARDRLDVEGGVLVSDHWGIDLERFLANHHTSAEMLGPIIEMLRAQVATPPVFAEKCAGCHGRAAEFVRSGALIEQDGTLLVRASGLPVAVLLERHGGVDAAEAAAIVLRLAALLAETAAPGP